MSERGRWHTHVTRGVPSAGTGPWSRRVRVRAQQQPQHRKHHRWARRRADAPSPRVWPPHDAACITPVWQAPTLRCRGPGPAATHPPSSALPPRRPALVRAGACVERGLVFWHHASPAAPPTDAQVMRACTRTRVCSVLALHWSRLTTALCYHRSRFTRVWCRDQCPCRESRWASWPCLCASAWQACKM